MPFKENDGELEKEFKPGVQSALSQIGKQLGERAENMVQDVFLKKQSLGLLPDWLYSWEHAEKNSRMDQDGIDFEFMTDLGPVFVNIKSSRTNAKNFSYYWRKCRITAVVVNVCSSEEKIYQDILVAIERERHWIMDH